MKKVQLTTEGYQNLENELKLLKESKRPLIVDRLQMARSMGDLSENSEYVAAKEELSFIEGRILEIEEILKNVEVIENQISNGKVVLGKTVVVEINSTQETFKLVGEYEADPVNHKVSPTSPIGQAFIDKKIGDLVEVITPAGKSTYKIIDIK